VHWYKFNIADYRKDTGHLSMLEHGIYRTLIDWYYLDEKPIPKETQSVMRRLSLGSEGLLSLQNVLSDFFVLGDLGYSHKRAELEIREYKLNATKNIANGKLGGRPKKTQSVILGNPNETQVEPNQKATSNQQPLTSNQQPVNSLAKAKGAKAPLTPDEIIFTYGVPMLTNAGTPEKQARSFLGGLRKNHGDDALIDKLRACIREKPLQPLEWLAKALPPGQTLNAQEKLEASNAAILKQFLEDDKNATQ
jgi:uncharacterized protein YdaU (DUF1376 family)